VEREREKPAAWRRVLEQTTGAVLRQFPGGPAEASDVEEAES
jgi:hypothetical protein